MGYIFLSCWSIVFHSLSPPKHFKFSLDCHPELDHKTLLLKTLHT